MPTEPMPPAPQEGHAEPLMAEDEVAWRLVPVIVGGTFLSYSYVREFHRAYGITRCIVVLGKEIKMLTSSRFTDCRIVPEAGETEGLTCALEKIAGELRAEDPRLVPLALGCDDRHALIFSQNRDRLEAAGYVVPCNDHDMLEAVSLKHRFYELCEELDVPYPKARYFDCSENGPEELPVDEFAYPLFAKPSDTTLFQNAEVAHKRKAYEIESPEELARVWSDVRASDYDGELVVQDFIPGGDENLRILNTFSDGEGNIRAVSGGVVCLQDHNPAALGNPLCIIGERDEQVIECAQRLLRRLRFSGFANFDLKYDERTGRCCFFEINIRAGRSTYYMSLGVVNFVTPPGGRLRSGTRSALRGGLRPVRLLLRPPRRAQAQHRGRRMPEAHARTAQAHEGPLPAALRARHARAQLLVLRDVLQPDTQVQALLLGHGRQAVQGVTRPADALRATGLGSAGRLPRLHVPGGTPRLHVGRTRPRAKEEASARCGGFFQVALSLRLLRNAQNGQKLM